MTHYKPNKDDNPELRKFEQVADSSRRNLNEMISRRTAIIIASSLGLLATHGAAYFVGRDHGIAIGVVNGYEEYQESDELRTQEAERQTLGHVACDYMGESRVAVAKAYEDEFLRDCQVVSTTVSTTEASSNVTTR